MTLTEQHEPVFVPVQRPAFALAFLARCGQGEITVRSQGLAVDRRYFDLPRCECGGLMDHGAGQCESCRVRR